MKMLLQKDRLTKIMVATDSDIELVFEIYHDKKNKGILLIANHDLTLDLMSSNCFFITNKKEEK